MTSSIVCLLGLALVASAVNAQYNRCNGQSDGTVVEFGCDGYTDCFDNKERKVLCPNGEVYERDSQSCKLIGTGNTACGTTSANVCPDGTFTALVADRNCQTFFSCVWGSYWPNSRRYCPNTSLFYNNACQSPVGAPASCVRTIVTSTTTTTTTTTATTKAPNTTTTTTQAPTTTTTTTQAPNTTTTTTQAPTTTEAPNTTEAQITTEAQVVTEAQTTSEALAITDAVDPVTIEAQDVDNSTDIVVQEV